MLITLCIILFANKYLVESARILGVFPMPSSSHQGVFQTLISELVVSGHEVVLVTTNPKYVNETSPDNLTEINLSSSHLLLKNSMISFKKKRGIVLLDSYKVLPNTFSQIVNHTLENDDFKKLLKNENEHFDLIITEALFISPLMLAKKYNAPLIWFSSYYGTDYNYETVGAPIHPILYPEHHRANCYNLNIWERMSELFTYSKYMKSYEEYKRKDMETVKKTFKDTPDTVIDLTKFIDLLYINVNPIFEGNRPIPPNLVHFGSLHIQPVPELPEELQSYLDSSTRGVIYASLGSLVVPAMMDEDLRDAFLEAFDYLPYDILWKYQNASFTRKVFNLRTADWFPQKNLLRHPNIKAFITQGGLQSTDEAIDAEVPLIGIPIVADQAFNVAQYVRLGIGVKLDPLTLVADGIIKGVNTVIKDKSYRENIREVKRRMQDQPQSPLQRAVWWTEFVLRHRGAKFLRAASASLSWAEYYQTDVILVLGIACVTLISVTTFAILTCVKKFFKFSSKFKQR